MNRHYDITIIGSGPAGLSAALYIKRAGLTCAVIGKDGGALEKAEKIENYFGTGAISGAELVKRGVEQAKELGADIFREEVFRSVGTAITPYRARRITLSPPPL